MRRSLDKQQILAKAFAIAKVPTLLPVLVQMTGETRCLDAPYRVRREPGLGGNDTGGLPQAVQQTICDAVPEAILACQGGRPLLMVEPSEQMLDAC
jgi:4-hydroxyacetophenone monooxygenase